MFALLSKSTGDGNIFLKKMRKFNFSYDKENDDLFLFISKSKSRGSVELGDMVLDFNNKKELVGLQIMNASKLFKDILSDNVNGIKSVLRNLKECKIDAKLKRNIMIIKIFLVSEKREIAPVMQVPTISRSSPSLAYA